MKALLELLAPFVPLLQTLVWVLLLVVGVAIFFRQCRDILTAIRNRIETGSSLKAGPLELGEDLRELEYIDPSSAEGDESSLDGPLLAESTDLPAPVDWASERNALYEASRGLFLAHVIEPSRTPRQVYDIFIYLVRHKSSNFEDVSFAEFFFGRYWGTRVFREEPQDGLIGVSTSAYGPFLCTCRVTFNDGHVAQLSRYIDFEMGRVFETSSNPSLQLARASARR